MRGKVGSSSVPRPRGEVVPRGSAPAAITASISAGLVHGREVVLGGVGGGDARQRVEHAECARPARRSGRPGSGSSGGWARSRRRSATRRTPGRRGRSGRPCAGTLLATGRLTRRATKTPSASATTLNSPLSMSRAKPRHAGTGAGAIWLSKAIHSTSSKAEAGNGGPSSPKVSPTVYSSVRRAIRAPSVSEAATRLPSGMRSSTRSTAAVRAGVSQKSASQAWENACWGSRNSVAATARPRPTCRSRPPSRTAPSIIAATAMGTRTASYWYQGSQ